MEIRGLVTRIWECILSGWRPTRRRGDLISPSLPSTTPHYNTWQKQDHVSWPTGDDIAACDSLVSEEDPSIFQLSILYTVEADVNRAPLRTFNRHRSPFTIFHRQTFSQRPTPHIHTMPATTVERSDAAINAGGIKVLSIAMLIRVANMPPAGVNPPYMNDWKAAANVPKVTRECLVIDWGFYGSAYGWKSIAYLHRCQ